MSSTLHFPSQTTIISYLEQNPKTNDPYFVDRGILEAIAKCFADTDKRGVNTGVMLTMYELNKEIEIPEMVLMSIQEPLVAALTECATRQEAPPAAAIAHAMAEAAPVIQAAPPAPDSCCSLCNRKVLWIALAALAAVAAAFLAITGIGYLAIGAFAGVMISIGSLSTTTVATLYLIAGSAFGLVAAASTYKALQANPSH